MPFTVEALNLMSQPEHPGSLKQISLIETEAIGSPSPTDAQALNDSHESTENIDNEQRRDSSSDITADDEFLDEAYAESSRSGYLTSLASDVRRGVLENGRIYPSYGRHEYAMPVDEQELDRNDLQHAKFMLLLGDRLFLAPISPSQTRILDIGTGTGIWAIDMGDIYPEAEVIGTDIAPVQPSWIPPNVQFFLEDAEDLWTFSPSTFSFVFAREMSFAVRDWSKLISQAWTALRPGGWLELSATHPRTHCDDGSLDLTNSPLAQTAEIYLDIAEAIGASLNAPYSWAQQMQEAGFIDIETRKFKMPLGPWPKDKRLKKLGLLELASLSQGFEAYILRGWTQVLKRPVEECYAFTAEGRKEMHNPKYHTYCYFIVVTGRKPE